MTLAGKLADQRPLATLAVTEVRAVDPSLSVIVTLLPLRNVAWPLTVIAPDFSAALTMSSPAMVPIVMTGTCVAYEMPTLTRFCSSLSESTLPVSNSSLMASKTPCRLLLLLLLLSTPVMPSAAKSAAFKAGEAWPPKAVVMMRLTMLASAFNSLYSSTKVAVLASITSFSKLASAAVSIEFRPSNWYCAALSVTLLLVPSPSAPASSRW